MSVEAPEGVAAPVPAHAAPETPVPLPAPDPVITPPPVQASVTPGAGPVFPVPDPVVTELPTAASLADAQTAVEPDAPRTADERLEPEPTGPVTLKGGLQVDVVPLRLRETMKLLKIVTTGAGQFLQPLMGQLNTDNPKEFAQTLGALVLMSIPDATDEAVAFVQAMVQPAGLAEMEDQPAKISAIQALQIELYNPDLDDVVSIVERVIRRESEDLRSLGKRIAAAFKMAAKVGELPKPVLEAAAI